jgi:MoaA/NifB/PqqE/SkfB family radical SAM enzyme
MTDCSAGKIFFFLLGLPERFIRWSCKWSVLLIRAGNNAAFRALHKLPKVEYLVYEITDACNSRCQHCHIWAQKPTDNMLTPDELKRILGDGLFGDLKLVLLTGGEPVLRKDIKELIAAIHEARPRAQISLSTNGLLPDKVLEVANFAVAHGIVLNVGMSLDGIGKKHDLLRGVEGNFEKMDYLVRALAGLRSKYPKLIKGLVIGHTLSPLSIDTLREVLDYAGQAGVSGFTQLCEDFVYYHNPKNAAEVKDYRSADNSALIGAVRSLPPSLHYEMLLNALNHTLRFKCAAMRKFFLLRCDGSVAPCLCYCDKTCGNARSEGLSKVWNSQAAWEERERVKNCSGCSNSWATDWSFGEWVFSAMGIRARLFWKTVLRKLGVTA